MTTEKYVLSFQDMYIISMDFNWNPTRSGTLGCLSVHKKFYGFEKEMNLINKPAGICRLQCSVNKSSMTALKLVASDEGVNDWLVRSSMTNLIVSEGSNPLKSTTYIKKRSEKRSVI